MWLDTFIATPTIGLQTVPSFDALYKYPERLQPFLDEVFAREQEIQLVNEPTGGFVFKTKRGFSYKLLLDNIILEFAYSPSDKRLPGHLPAPEMPPVENFSVLLDETFRQLVRVVGLLSAASEPPKVNRFGLLVNVLMEKSKAPPGVADMIGQHASFFPGKLIKADSTFLVDLDRTDVHVDRCHHTYVFDDATTPDHLAVRLDWQRFFHTPLNLSTPAEPLGRMKEAALAYLEKVGRGGLKDA
jgi:hypothetical protein